MGENFTFSDPNEQCYYEELLKLRHKNGVLYCPAFHDSLNCLPFTEANSTIRLPCPPQLNAPANVYGVRKCGLDGNWTGQITDYSACVAYYDAIHNNQTYPTTDSNVEGNDEYDRRLAEILRDIYFITSIVSLLFLVITLFIFCYFRSLHCNRISIHKHLVVSFIIRFIVTIVMLEPVVFQHIEHSYLGVGWLCKVMRSFEKYTVLTNIYWMLVEGIYLHNNLVATVFSTEAPFKLFVFIGWIFPALPTVSWAVAKELTNPSYCWHEKSDLDNKLNFILLAPLLLALALNLIFLINIIRVLVTKLRAKNTHESSRIKKAIRATIILLPLLGLTNLLFIYNPEDGGSLQMVYHVTNALIQGMQGVLISIFYCFLNGEVKRVLRRKYRRCRIKYHLKNSGRRRSSWTSSFVMSQTEDVELTSLTRNSSSTDSNHGIPVIPANNNRYIKADLILEVCDETKKHGSDCQSCENIPRLDEFDEKNKVNVNIKPLRKDSAKLNNVHFAMEGDKVKCETFPAMTSCSSNFEKSTSTIDKPNNLDVENARKENLKKNGIEYNGGVNVENSRNENLDETVLEKRKMSPEATHNLVTGTDNSLCENGNSETSQNQSETEYNNRFSTFSLGEGMFGIVDGFADDVSEEITRLLQT